MAVNLKIICICMCKQTKGAHQANKVCSIHKKENRPKHRTLRHAIFKKCRQSQCAMNRNLLAPTRQIRCKPVQCDTSNTKANFQPLKRFLLLENLLIGCMPLLTPPTLLTRRHLVITCNIVVELNLVKCCQRFCCLPCGKRLNLA